MEVNWFYELIGYAASAFIAASLTMNSIEKLRIINFFGCICFITYGLLIQAYPVALVNFYIALINLYHLRRMYLAKAAPL